MNGVRTERAEGESFSDHRRRDGMARDQIAELRDVGGIEAP
jgi:hypothetical protein